MGFFDKITSPQEKPASGVCNGYNQQLYESVMNADDLGSTTGDMLQSIVTFKCMKLCNPSSFMQTLVAGSENSSAHQSEMNAKKNECSLGCVQAIRMAKAFPQIVQKQAEVINVDPAEFSVQDKKSLKTKYKAYADLVHDLESKCSLSCVDMCKGAGKAGHRNETGASVVNGELACIKNCARGCEHFFDTMKNVL